MVEFHATVCSNCSLLHESNQRRAGGLLRAFFAGIVKCARFTGVNIDNAYLSLQNRQPAYYVRRFSLRLFRYSTLVLSLPIVKWNMLKSVPVQVLSTVLAVGSITVTEEFRYGGLVADYLDCPTRTEYRESHRPSHSLFYALVLVLVQVQVALNCHGQIGVKFFLQRQNTGRTRKRLSRT